VKSIHYAGKLNCRNIEVQENQTYLLESGIVSHNSMLNGRIRKVSHVFIRIPFGTPAGREARVYLLKCLPGFVDIVTNDGINNLKDLHALQEPIALPSYDFETKKFITDQALIKLIGRRQTFKVTLEDGSYVPATKNHRFFVSDNGNVKEKRVAELKPGDFLIGWED